MSLSMFYRGTFLLGFLLLPAKRRRLLGIEATSIISFSNRKTCAGVLSKTLPLDEAVRLPDDNALARRDCAELRRKVEASLLSEPSARVQRSGAVAPGWKAKN